MISSIALIASVCINPKTSPRVRSRSSCWLGGLLEELDVARAGQRHRRGRRGYRARRREVKELPHLIALSKRMMRTIKLNITFSLTLNFIAIVLAIIGTLNPVVGALVHNAGSVLCHHKLGPAAVKWRQTASQSFASADAKSV